MKRSLLWILALSLLLPCAATFGSCAPASDVDTSPNTPENEPPDGIEPEPGADLPPQDAPTTDGLYADHQETITDYLNVFGRTPVIDGGLAMYWTNSGFSFAFRGTSGTLCIDHNGTYTLAGDLPDGDHTIEVRKRNEAIYGESATLTLKKLTVTDGQFCKKPPEKPYNTIEFIGDSITSGFGNMVTDGGGPTANFSTHTQDGTLTYATIAARSVDANASVLSRSGICYVIGSDRPSMYPYYVQTAVLPGNGVDASYWDFDRNTSDVIVINLGTNDTGARIDGKPITEQQYRDQAYDFIRLVRANNPDAVIIWAYGMMTPSGGKPIEAAVKMCNDEGDDEVYYCPLPLMNREREGVGVHGHPDYLSHLNAALTLADFLNENAYVDADYTPMLCDAVLIAAQYLPEDAPVLQNANALLTNGCESDAAKEAVRAIIDACHKAFTAK